MYSFFCALGIFFVIFVVPETKGRDLENIQKLFAVKDTKSGIEKKSTLNLAPVDSSVKETERDNSIYEVTKL